MHSVILTFAIGGTVMMSMFAAAFVSVREAELRGAAPLAGRNAGTSLLE